MNFEINSVAFYFYAVSTVMLVINVILLKSNWPLKILIASLVYGFWVDEFQTAVLYDKIDRLNHKIVNLNYEGVSLSDEIVKLKSELKGECLGRK